MFKKSYLFMTLLIAMFVLAACGSSADNNNDAETENDAGQAPTEETENDGAEENAEEDSTEAVEEDATEDKDNSLENEENTEEAEEDTANDETESTDDDLTDAEMTDSDAQNFSMYVLPEYTLTSEEPGKDSLYLTENGQIFMRIETMPADDETYEYLKENTISTLEASGSEGNAPAEITDSGILPEGEGISDTVGYSIETDEIKMSGIVFERDGMLVRLTIFDTLSGEHFNDFVKMGETIQSK